MRIQKLIFVCLILFRTSQCQINQERLQKAVETGRSHYEEYQNEANKDECWRMAVASLNETCRDLSQSARQRLAIAFANCHWLSAGRRAYECSEEMTIANCTSEMTESAFDVFTQFFNHLEDACFYLQSQLWQEKTERLITDLSDTSEEAVTKITESLKRHEILQKGQEQSLHNQNELIKNGEQLHNQLHSAREEVSVAFTSIQQQAWSFKEQFNEIFMSLSDGLDKINHVLTWLLGEFISFERFIVFIVGILMAYLMTCSKYTAKARPSLMMIIIIESVFLERFVVTLYLNYVDNSPSIMEGIHFILWIIRYVTAFICLLLLMYFYMAYCNYEEINHQLLKKIIEQNRQIKRHLKLDTEEFVDEPSKTPQSFIPTKTSTPSSTPFTNETVVVPSQSAPSFVSFTNESVILSPAPAAVRQLNRSSEIGRPRLDSVDGDQPDSGIEEATDNNTHDSKQSRYYLRKRCKDHRHNKTIENESPQEFANVVYQNEQLTRNGLRYNRNSSNIVKLV